MKSRCEVDLQIRWGTFERINSIKSGLIAPKKNTLEVNFDKIFATLKELPPGMNFTLVLVICSPMIGNSVNLEFYLSKGVTITSKKIGSNPKTKGLFKIIKIPAQLFNRPIIIFRIFKIFF